MSIGDLPLERLFSMPAFEGVRTLRGHMVAQPGLDISAAIGLVQRIEFDARALDLEASAVLFNLIPADLPNDGPHFYRGCIREILLAFRPPWARIMLQGRSRFYQAMERNEQSLLRQAGLLDEPPEDAFVDWWDALTTELRFVVNLDKLVQGRAAERLSIAHEIDRLAAIGVHERPKWIGLDDNTKGYDVLSYDLVDGELVNKLIEVKSTIASPLRFIVTRNEWNQAERSGDRYVFHVWDMQKQPRALHVRTVEQVLPHIPSDNEKGEWKDVEIPLGAVN